MARAAPAQARHCSCACAQGLCPQAVAVPLPGKISVSEGASGCHWVEGGRDRRRAWHAARAVRPPGVAGAGPCLGWLLRPGPRCCRRPPGPSRPAGFRDTELQGLMALCTGHTGELQVSRGRLHPPLPQPGRPALGPAQPSRGIGGRAAHDGGAPGARHPPLGSHRQSPSAWAGRQRAVTWKAAGLARGQGSLGPQQGARPRGGREDVLEEAGPPAGGGRGRRGQSRRAGRRKEELWGWSRPA